MRNVRSAVAISCAMGMLAATPAASQTFMGVVTDSAGHVIPGAEARLASMDGQALIAVRAGAGGTFRVTPPHANGKRRRYWAELCAPGFAPEVEAVPLAAGDSLVVRGALVKAKSRVVPMGTGACAWDVHGQLSITGGHGFAVVAARTTQRIETTFAALPHDSAARADSLHGMTARWLHELHATDTPAAQARAAWVLLQIAYVSDERADPALLAEVRKALPPNSPWWQAGGSGEPLVPLEAVATLFGVTPRDTRPATLTARRSARDYLSNITAARYDPDVDAQQRHELALFDLGMRDTTAATERAKALLINYPGYTAARLTTFRMPWLSPLRTGNPMPKFDFAELRTSAPARLMNRDLRAPYTLVVFWGTWCEQCLKELPQLDSLHAEYHARGLDIVSIAADDSPEVVNDFFRTHAMPWRQAYAGTTQDPDVQRLGVLGFPTTVVVDSTGTIRSSRFGLGDLRAMIEPLLNK